MKFERDMINSGVPDGWYMEYHRYPVDHWSSAIRKFISIIKVYDNGYAYLHSNGRLNGYNSFDNLLGRVAGDYELFRLSDEEVEKHVTMEYI